MFMFSRLGKTAMKYCRLLIKKESLRFRLTRIVNEHKLVFSFQTQFLLLFVHIFSPCFVLFCFPICWTMGSLQSTLPFFYLYCMYSILTVFFSNIDPFFFLSK